MTNEMIKGAEEISITEREYDECRKLQKTRRKTADVQNNAVSKDMYRQLKRVIKRQYEVSIHGICGLDGGYSRI